MQGKGLNQGPLGVIKHLCEQQTKHDASSGADELSDVE